MTVPCIPAGASAAAWTCGDSVAIVELEVTAKALAEATAIAFSYAFVDCKVDGGWTCAFASSDIEQTARATATAYAELWAGAYTCKDTCSVEVDAVVEAVGDILVKAATEASADVCLGATLAISPHASLQECYSLASMPLLNIVSSSISSCSFSGLGPASFKCFGACADGVAYWTVHDLALQIESASLCALAEASAVAISISPHTCLAGGIVSGSAEHSMCPVH